jgi:hypothetical protein
MLADH